MRVAVIAPPWLPVPPDGYGGTELVLDTTAALKEVAEAIAALLSRTGLRVRAQVWEGAVLTPMWQNPERRRERDMYLTSWGNGSPDPSDIMVPTLRTGGGGNSAGFSNAEVDRLLDAAETEPDQEKRAAMYQRAQAIVTDQAPWIFLWLPQDIYGVSKRIAGWKPQADSRINLIEHFMAAADPAAEAVAPPSLNDFKISKSACKQWLPFEEVRKRNLSEKFRYLARRAIGRESDFIPPPPHVIDASRKPKDKTPDDPGSRPK